MKEELLSDLKEELERSSETLAEYNKNVKRMKYLLLDSNVRKFIKLANIDMKSLNTKEKTLDDIKNETIENLITFINRYRENDTNNIYFDFGKFEGKLEKIGKYSYSTKPSDKTFRFKKPVYVNVYKNIENSKDEHVIPVTDSEKFEKDHIIISSDNYDLVQKEFITDMLEIEQEEAVKKLIKKYQK